MAFLFKRANCVAVGTFNMYIIQPAWLAEVGIIPRGTEVAISSKIDAPGFRFSSPKLPARWIVTPNLIQVETDQPDIDCGEAVAKVIEKLPWTPLIAIGNNSIYEAPLEELVGTRIPLPATQVAPEGFEFTQRTIHYGLKHGSTVFNIQLAITEDEVALTLNAHTELGVRKSEEAKHAAQQFFHDRQTAEGLVSHFFQSSLTYADTDHQSLDKKHGGNGEQ